MQRSRVAFALILFAGGLLAQESRSTVSGRVLDPQGALLPSARVMATETRTNVKTQAATDNSGQYVLPFLPPGNYRLTVEVAGFKRYEQPGLILNAGDHPVIDITLQLGQVNESVTVEATAPLLSTADASTGQVITAHQVEALPLNGRTPLVLTQVTAGVINTAAALGQTRAFDNSGASAFSIAGLANKTSEVLLDGAPDNASDNSVAYNPPQDAVQEVRVHTFESDAAYGHSGAGVANQITRSGTNSFHGSAWEFNETSYLAGNSYFSNKNRVKRAVSRFNQYGMTAGGPLYLPKVYNGKDKVFWFFAYEGIKNAVPGSSYTTVPTAAEKTGDFSALLNAGTQYQIYNPFSSSLNASGGVVRQPFPNNAIPSSLISPIATNYMKYYPSPNVAAARADGFNNYFSLVPSTDAFDNEFGRIDFNLSANHKLFVSGRHNDRLQNFNDYFGNVATGDRLARMNWGGTIDDVITISPRMVANVRLNYTRYQQNQNIASSGLVATELGFPASLAAAAPYPLMPRIQLLGTGTSCQTPSTSASASYQCLGYTNNTPSLAPFNSYGLFADVMKIQGNHSLKFGVDARDFRKSSYVIGSSQGSFNFDATWTRALSTSSAAAPLGADMAAFLVGLPTGGQIDLNAQFTAKNAYAALFIQDDWRVRSNLTLNIGLRFERDFPGTEAHNRAVNGFDTSVASPVSAAAIAAYAKNPMALLPASGLTVNGGLTFANADNPHVYESQSYTFSPRFGFAWTPGALKGKTVIRGGTGFFVIPIVPWNSALNQQGFSQTTQVVTTANNYLSPSATLANPFPNGVTQPVGSSQGLSTFLGQGITLFNPNYQNGYSYRWQLGVQRQLPGSVLAEVAYVGNHAVRLGINRNINWVRREFLSTASNSSLSASVANPFAGLLPGTNYNGSSISQLQLLARYPQFPVNSVTMQQANAGSSYFDALEMRVEKRPGHGITLNANYQWSKVIERASYLHDSDLRPEKRVSSLDHTQHLVGTVTFELPFGRGRKFSLGHSRLLDLAVGGWTWNGIYTYQSGAPLAWGNLVYLGLPLDLNPRARDVAAFNTAAFNRTSAAQPVNNLRTFNSQFGNLRADAINNIDASLMKAFHFTEKMYLQLRLEAYNSMNHPQFGTPNLTPTSSAFGTITGTANGARQVQIGGRLVW